MEDETLKMRVGCITSKVTSFKLFYDMPKN